MPLNPWNNDLQIVPEPCPSPGSGKLFLVCRPAYGRTRRTVLAMSTSEDAAEHFLQTYVPVAVSELNLSDDDAAGAT